MNDDSTKPLSKERGLKGARLVIPDACLGLVDALANLLVQLPSKRFNWRPFGLAMPDFSGFRQQENPTFRPQAWRVLKGQIRPC